MKLSRTTALALVSACTWLIAYPLAAEDSAAVDSGKSLYLSHGCYSCHGYEGVGKRPLSPKTSGIVSNDEVFLVFLRARADVKPPLPKQWMPHYPESALPDEDALAILAYIRSFRDNPPSIAESETLSTILDAAR
jgi:mono/diheme cytochrome c family protein